MNDGKILSKNINRLRIERGWSMRALADFAGISFHTVFRAESKNIMPRGDTLAKIANALETTVADLFQEHIEQSSKQTKSANVLDRESLLVELMTNAATLDDDHFTTLVAMALNYAERGFLKAGKQKIRPKAG